MTKEQIEFVLQQAVYAAAHALHVGGGDKEAKSAAIAVVGAAKAAAEALASGD
jgi:hypothetical protein